MPKSRYLTWTIAGRATSDSFELEQTDCHQANARRKFDLLVKTDLGALRWSYARDKCARGATEEADSNYMYSTQ